MLWVHVAQKEILEYSKNNVIEQGKCEILLLNLQLQREYVKLFMAETPIVLTLCSYGVLPSTYKKMK